MKNNCDEIRDNISAYIDGELYMKDRTDFEAHLSSCEECQTILSETGKIVSTLNDIPDVEIPETFHQDLMRKLNYMSAPPIDLMTKKRLLKIKSSKSSRVKGINLGKIDVKKYSGFAASLVAGLLIVSAVGSFIGNMATTHKQQQITAEQPATSEAIVLEGRAAGAQPETDLTGTPKLYSNSVLEDAAFPQAAALSLPEEELTATGGHFIKTHDTTVSVEDFDKALELVDSLPGYNAHSYIRSDNSGSREASFSRRVSLEEYEIIKARIKEMGEIVSDSESGQRVDDSLFDLNLRLSAKESELERLNSLLERSKTIDVLAAVSRRISEVTSERDDIKGQIADYQDKIASPYVNISILAKGDGLAAPDKYTSFGGQVKNSFIHSANLCLMAMEGIMLFVASAMVPIITIFLAAVIYVISRRALKRGEHNEK